MSERKETCGNCRYWSTTVYDQGECRKRPPVIVDALCGPDGEIFGATYWPVTIERDWCGEWFRGANGG